MGTIILETKELTKSFRRHQQPALDLVSLRIPEGSVYGLLGPNGAGKSTLLKIITGMMRPDSGRVFYKGREWTRECLRDTGALIETPPIYSNLTAGENLLVRTTALGLPRERIGEMLELVGLADTGKKRAGQFSLGMKQRLGIAAALIGHPHFLVLDEPTNGLDPFGIQELRELIRSFPGKGITVLVSSHILSEVEQMADHIGILSNGILGYQGGMPPKGHLEEMFMKVVEKSRNGNAGKAAAGGKIA